MEIKTFRARSLPAALNLIWRELGPDAKVLSTQQRPQGLFGRLTGSRLVEVTASSMAIHEPASAPITREETVTDVAPTVSDMPPVEFDYRAKFKALAATEVNESLLESLIEQHQRRETRALPPTLFQVFTDLLDADVDDGFARSAIAEIERSLTPAELADAAAVKDRLKASISQKIITCPPQSPGKRRVMALIGPTGVGKTTTIAKLAANYRLRDKLRVGLITVDTYRIAAVDQLRAYADIIDLPMEVVTTPREMRDAVTKLSDQDIVLIDTAGRSPHDEIQIQELKAMLTEARADEVQLVLSSVYHSRHLTRLVEHFRITKPTSLLLTKLDETTSRGHLLPLLCDSGVAISYTTHGQNVPDDIQPADPQRLIEPIFQSN